MYTEFIFLTFIFRFDIHSDYVTDLCIPNETNNIMHENVAVTIFSASTDKTVKKTIAQL